MREAGVKRKSRVLGRKRGHPSSRGPRREKIALVQHEYEMFVAFLLGQILLYSLRSRTHGVTSIKYLHMDTQTGNQSTL